jgi:hypothetical protein
MPIFFIAGFLYLLRFERVDNLGAYRIRSETGLLIPSDYINYPVWSVIAPTPLRDNGVISIAGHWKA